MADQQPNQKLKKDNHIGFSETAKIDSITMKGRILIIPAYLQKKAPDQHIYHMHTQK